MTDIAEFDDAFTVRQVFGEPIRHEGLSLIPVAKISGGGGGSTDGSGFGGTAKPIGALVMDEGRVYWRPVADAGKILAVVGAGAALFALARALKRRRARKATCRCNEHEDS
ncbi:putative spore protein YtfJ [Saccharopolyspora lacisalsi]|uniref:Putative spore protein YtfJ n=1 Tax=Halosaccharopolyspora lacisalsi TaxID=1000566 RepID=A0A839E0J4_9PSEU|nr:sporulation protein [Halosaccharopolyspora lacisalsi]MBA8826620.1 putative spore protein YtfJ [Halosaccharopolyspora lacisalsi]